jgi:hypothetical protein
MKPRTALFLASPGDNVAVALGNLQPGMHVPLLSSNGQQVAEIMIQADVPIFFKVSITELQDDEELIKHGCKIGRVVSKVYSSGSLDRKAEHLPIALPPGTPLHLTNFVPSSSLIALCGGSLAQALGVSFSLCKPDYGFGIARKKITAGQEIRRSHISTNQRMKELLDRLTPAKDSPVLGCASDTIAEGALVRLGCIAASPYLYQGDAAKVEMLGEYYRFLKGRIYEHS